MANTKAKRRKKQGGQRTKLSLLKARDETRKMSAAAADASESTARAATDLMRGQLKRSSARGKSLRKRQKALPRDRSTSSPVHRGLSEGMGISVCSSP